MLRFIQTVSATVLFLLVAAPAYGYQPPVVGDIVDPFRLPDTPYGAGNRGVDYQTTPGAEVRAADDGIVTFAGTVGVDKFVVVDHVDGVRTTYGYLLSVVVHVGDHVVTGQVVGISTGHLHFGARYGDRYIDPMSLFGGPHLVPIDSAPATRRASISPKVSAWLQRGTTTDAVATSDRVSVSHSHLEVPSERPSSTPVLSSWSSAVSRTPFLVSAVAALLYVFRRSATNSG